MWAPCLSCGLTARCEKKPALIRLNLAKYSQDLPPVSCDDWAEPSYRGIAGVAA